ncbi:MAG: NAD(P)/FAD-dependent oxidoreductase [Phycisphaerales bacterium]|nr:NAD(P)/FAD-dependent oxidoreductase [Phycisphaerales bacterium]
MVVGEFAQEAELVIIGAGPAGYEAAFHAAASGQKVTLVDPRENLGGRCLHEACIPSKLIATRLRMVRDGVINEQEISVPAIPQTQLLEMLDQTVASLGTALNKQASSLNITVVQGTATFQDGRSLGVNSDPPQRFKFRRAIIATGTTPGEHPALDHNVDEVQTPAASWTANVKDQRVLIVGQEMVALEVGSILAELGGLVTIADLSPDKHDIDRDLQRPAQRRLRALGASFMPHAKLLRSNAGEGKITVQLNENSTEKTETFDLVVDCTTPRPSSSSLGLDTAGISTDADGFITVDSQQRTSNPRIFAAGDVTGTPLLASKAAHQGRIAVDAMAEQPVAFDPAAIPWTIYTNPPMAGCGMSESDADDAGIPNASTKKIWGASGLAAAQGRTDGVTKLVYDTDSGLLLGGFISGVGAAEMIQQVALALELGATMEDLASTIHAHPTRSELIASCAQDAVGAINSQTSQ